MTELEMLLRRYAEGDITPDELQRLSILSHRDEVLADAASRAKTLRRQRATRMSMAASVALVVAVIVVVALRSGSLSGVNDTVMVADATTPAATVSPIEVAAEPVPQVAMPVHRQARRTTIQEVAEDIPVGIVDEKAAAAVVAQQEEHRYEEPRMTEHAVDGYPVVACNSECSPDSVINDIWRFLRV